MVTSSVNIGRATLSYRTNSSNYVYGWLYVYDSVVIDVARGLREVTVETNSRVRRLSRATYSRLLLRLSSYAAPDRLRT